MAAVLINAAFVSAQVPAEFASGSMTATNGPGTVTPPARLLQNAAGTTYTIPNTTVNVTASTSLQQYTGTGTGTGNPVVMFGANILANSTAPASVTMLSAMNSIGAPANGNFSNNTAGTAAGIDVATNYAFDVLTSVNQWNQSSSPSTNNVRIRMADLTLTFSSPVTNPYLQFVGLGGVTSNLGFATELDLFQTVSTTGTITGTFTKIQGNTTFVVTANQINNGAAVRNSSCATNVAGCGTVRLNGSNITSITLRVYIKGDGGDTVWGTAGNHGGDRWLLGVSLPETVSLSGTVFNDVNGSTDSTVNGTGFNNPSGVQLYANLIDPSDNSVIGSVAVAANGTYTFAGVPTNTGARVEISTVQGTPTNAAPAVTLPTNWVNTGESPDSPALTDGTITVAVAAANVTNLDFGIEQRPTANNNTAPSQANPGGTVSATVPATTFTVSDTGGGTVLSIRITAFSSNATSFTVGTTTYYPNAGSIPGVCPTATCAAFPGSGVTIPTNADGNPTTAISIDPVDGAVTVNVLYVAVDEAGIESLTAATAAFPFGFAPTAADGSIAGTLRFGNQLMPNTLVVLTDTTTSTKSFTRTDANGSYIFAEQETGRTYIVQPLRSKYTFSPGSSLVSLVESVAGLNFNSSAKAYHPKNDFDGDGISDVAVFRPTDGNWYVLRSSDAQMNTFKFGAETDVPVSADFDGDGKTDYAVYRPSEGNWYIWQSATQDLRVERFGAADDKLVPADYDGDGKADVAVYRGGTWYIRRSSDGGFETKHYGADTDTPLTGDFDNDGKSDFSVYRPADGTWYTLLSASGNSSARRFGAATDVPTAADFDGDGYADIAQFRSGIWYILNSTTDFEASRFGTGEDKSIVGDYDGDGRADTTTFRDGLWTIHNSADGTIRTVHFGLPTDITIK